MDDAIFDQATSAYLAWLVEKGVKINPKMAIADFRKEGRGRGVVAINEIEEDEVIFSIPRDAVLSMKNIVIEGKLGLTEEKLEKMPPWLSLTVIMMFESLSTNSIWAPYFAVLPSKSNALIFWNKDQLASLGASAVRDKIGKRAAEEMFHTHVETLEVRGLTLELFHKTASTIMAYAFDIPEEDSADELDDQNGEDLVPDEEPSTILSMIPLADMLNADADRNNARLVCDHKELEMRAIKLISKGEEILNDYGPLPSSDLLRRYGYVTDKYAPYDVVEIAIELVIAFFTAGHAFQNLEGIPIENISSTDLEVRIDLAKREDIFEDSYVVSHASSDGPCIPEELIALIWLLLIDGETLSAIKHSGASVPSRSKMCTELVGTVLKRLLEGMEGFYDTTVEEDEAYLRNEFVSGEENEIRHVMGRTIQLGEKLVLREASHEAASFTGSNSRMRINNGKREAEDDAPKAAKRSKIR